MFALRERLSWDSARGTLHDGPRRYVMMRPDVLIGAALRLDAAARAAWLEALAASVREHGAQSLRDYAAQAGGDAGALLDATAAAAADLGWGRWSLQRNEATLALEVAGSPFADGWRAAGGAPAPACAAIRGMLGGLADIVLGPGAAVEEHECAAWRHACCRFVATRAP